MQEAQRLSIHVVSANALCTHPDFLASLATQADLSYQVIHVNLESQHGSSSDEETMHHPEVIKLRTLRNVGMVRGHNQAIALALSRWVRSVWSERFVVLSRSEVMFDRYACQEMLRAFDADPHLMIAGPMVFWADTHASVEGDCIELTPTQEIYTAGIGLTRSRTLVFWDRGFAERVQRSNEQMFLSDACVVIRASALEALALFEGVWLDPRLPSFFSVMDLCWRAARQGSRARLLPEARVWFAPQERSHAARMSWRETYVPYIMRKRTDDFLLRIVHAPWICFSFLRYRCSRLFFSRFWEERLRLDVLARSHLPDLKYERRSDTAVPLKERRRWFM